MARIWTEGFEFRNSTSGTWQPVGSYDGYNFVANGGNIYTTYEDGRSSGYALMFNYASNSNTYYRYLSKPLQNLSEVFIRFWHKQKTDEYITRPFYKTIKIFELNDLYYISAEAFDDIALEGKKYYLCLYDNLGNLLYKSDIVFENEWHKIDVRYKANSIGGLQLKIDDKLVYSIDSATPDETISELKFGNINPPTPFGSSISISQENYYDDIAVNDTSGTINNSWCGNGHVYRVVPTANGSVINSIPSTGDNYGCIDDTATNDKDYVTMSTDGGQDLYLFNGLTSLADNSAKLNYVGLVVRAKNDGMGYLNPVVKNNGQIIQYPEKFVGADFNGISYDITLNPLTGQPFSVSELSNSEIGYIAKK